MTVTKTDEEWGKQLIKAAERNNLDALCEAIAHCPDSVHAKDVDGYTALNLVAYYGHDEAAKILLDAGADINAKDYIGRTPLHRAACAGWNGKTSMVKLLLEYRNQKADLNGIDVDGDTPLHGASSVGYAEIVKLLLAAGADITIKNNNSRSALEKIGTSGDCKKLLQDAANGKRPTLKDVGLKLMTTQDEMMARAIKRRRAHPEAQGWER